MPNQLVFDALFLAVNTCRRI